MIFSNLIKRIFSLPFLITALQKSIKCTHRYGHIMSSSQSNTCLNDFQVFRFRFNVDPKQCDFPGSDHTINTDTVFLYINVFWYFLYDFIIQASSQIRFKARLLNTHPPAFHNFGKLCSAFVVNDVINHKDIDLPGFFARISFKIIVFHFATPSHHRHSNYLITKGW